jgi:hypothetical protein
MAQELKPIISIAQDGRRQIFEFAFVGNFGTFFEPNIPTPL